MQSEQTKQKISVFLTGRKNSKYLAKFLHGFFTRTADIGNTELFITLNKNDTWNRELQAFYMALGGFAKGRIQFFDEDRREGRAGLHNYFNEMAEFATGDWLVYFCDDHFIIRNGWDNAVRNFVEAKKLDSKKIYSIIPKFDNCGAMNQIVSRGFYNSLGYLGRHGWIDSYINDVSKGLPTERIMRMDDELFHDFTHDTPSPMSDEHCQTDTSRGDNLPRYQDRSVQKLVQEDRDKLMRAIRAGR